MTAQEHNPAALEREINRRRTFAIISHPDAGKTTITEKLLLYGGAIQDGGAGQGLGWELPVVTAKQRYEHGRWVTQA